MRTYLQHPVDLGNHVKLAWLATSAAAAYGKRERWRRAGLRKPSPRD